MMDKLALEMETFEEILERFEVDVAQAKQCGDYSQMVSEPDLFLQIQPTISMPSQTHLSSGALVK